MELYCFNNSNIYLFHLSPTLCHLHPLQVENCDSNFRLVVDNNGKSGLKRVKGLNFRQLYRREYNNIVSLEDII